jgi:hypothetical protein
MPIYYAFEAYIKQYIYISQFALVIVITVVREALILIIEVIDSHGSQVT